MRYIVLIISLMSFLGCAEPIDFNIQKDELIVVDGKVSTESGGSYVRLYTTNSKSGTKQDLSGYNVSILSSTNNKVTLVESDTFPGRYLPNSFFQGQVGLEYSMTAISPSGLVIKSANDKINNPIPFQITIDDIFEEEAGAAGVLTTKRIKAISALLESENSSQYQSQFTFSYFYKHHFTKDSLERSAIDQFTLFDCAVPTECESGNQFLVAKQPDLSWYFSNPACGGPQINCPASCCLRATDWDTVFEIRQEAMSPQTFKFWSDIENLLNNDGLIFDTFPFTVVGNVSCENCDIKVLGNVSAVAVTKQKQNVFL